MYDRRKWSEALRDMVVARAPKPGADQPMARLLDEWAEKRKAREAYVAQHGQAEYDEMDAYWRRRRGDAA